MNQQQETPHFLSQKQLISIGTLSTKATVNYILTNAGNDSITSNNISFNVVLACDQSLTPPSIMFNAKTFLQMLDLNKNLQITTLKITGGAYR